MREITEHVESIQLGSETIEDIYGFEVSDGMVSDITDRLLSAALRNNFCKFKNCDKNVMMERHEKSAAPFITVYNGYCNLSRFFGYQPDGGKLQYKMSPKIWRKI